VIVTNTFGANAVRLSRFGFKNRVGEINKAAARTAQKAALGKNVCVAGSVGPLRGHGRLDEGKIYEVNRLELFPSRF
jgi:methionine synthase I (cobalamin-dependent)